VDVRRSRYVVRGAIRSVELYGAGPGIGSVARAGDIDVHRMAAGQLPHDLTALSLYDFPVAI
jgi:hypothetical protein